MVSIAMTEINKRIIDGANGASPVTRNGMIKLIVIYVALIFGSMVVGIISSLISAVLNERFSFGIRKQIYEKIINSHWMDVKRYHTGDLMTRLTSDAGNIANGIVGTIPNIILLGIQLVVVFFYLFYYSPMLAVLALLIAPISALVAWLLGKKLKVLQVKVQESESNYRSFLQESLANLLIVKAFANEKYSTDRLTELREERFTWVYKKTKMSIASSMAMSLAFQIGYIVAFVYGVFQVSSGAIT